MYLNIGSHPAPNDAETFDGFIDELSIYLEDSKLLMFFMLILSVITIYALSF